MDENEATQPGGDGSGEGICVNFMWRGLKQGVEATPASHSEDCRAMLAKW